MLESSHELWPVVARWSQPSDGGTVTWYLAGLGADRRYWGYVHFRTDLRQENQNFAGTLDETTFNRVASLIQKLAEHAESDPEIEPMDELVGIGTRSSLRRVFGIRNGVATSDDGSVVHAYLQFRGLMQLKLSANIQQ